MHTLDTQKSWSGVNRLCMSRMGLGKIFINYIYMFWQNARFVKSRGGQRVLLLMSCINRSIYIYISDDRRRNRLWRVCSKYY